MSIMHLQPIHTPLRLDNRRSRETRDPRGQVFDKRPDLVAGKGAVDDTPFFGGVGVDVVAAETHFHGPGTADEAGEASTGSCPRSDADCDLGLKKVRRLGLIHRPTL